MADTDPLIQVTRRVYVQKGERPATVLAHRGQWVRRSVLAAAGYDVPEPEAKKRPAKTVENKAVKPDSKKGEEEA